MSGSATAPPTHCSVTIWKLLFSTSASSVANSYCRTHALVARDPVAHVQADVLVVGSRRRDDLEAPFLLELMNDVGHDVVDDQIDRALAQLQPAHRVVRHDLHDHAAVLRRSVEVRVEGGQHDLVVREIADEPVGTGPDWPLRQ